MSLGTCVGPARTRVSGAMIMRLGRERSPTCKGVNSVAIGNSCNPGWYDLYSWNILRQTDNKWKELNLRESGIFTLSLAPSPLEGEGWCEGGVFSFPSRERQTFFPLPLRERAGVRGKVNTTLSISPFPLEGEGWGEGAVIPAKAGIQ